MERIKGANGELMKYSMQPMDGEGHLTLYRYDQLAVGGADNAHFEFWQEIEELRKQRADAQATIAALQARVKELEEWVQDQSTANLETMRHTDEMQSRALEAEQQLTQRTAERDALKQINDTHMKTVMKLSHVVEQRTAELEAAKDKVQFLEKKNRNLLDSSNMVLKVKADQDVRLDDLQAELKHVKGEWDSALESRDWWRAQLDKEQAKLTATSQEGSGREEGQKGA